MTDLCIVYDETFRTITVYASDADELDADDALEFATNSMGEDARHWTFVDYEHVNYDRVSVRFQRL